MPLDRSSSFGCGQLRDQEVEEDRQLLPVGVRVGQDGRQEAVGADERLGLALEVDLAVLVELRGVGGHAGVEDGVELVAVGPAQVQRRPAIARPARS